jgi:CubicO group peptidase (beta-lactamase class C family)
MKKVIFLTLFALTLSTSCKVQKQVANTSTLEAYANSIFQASIDSAQIAGGAILVYQKGKMLLNKSYGYASLELSTPMPMNGIFDIGSVTKQFTAAAILKLVEAGKLSLEDDFTKYLPYDSKGRKVTIAQLLDHTSGMEADISEEAKPAVKAYIVGSPFSEWTKLFRPKGFMFEPGEAMIYNNNAYTYLGLIIEKISGQSYEEFLKATFFEPLGMVSTSYGSNTEVIKNKVNGYNYSPKGLKQISFLNYNWPYSAGALSSSTQDLLTWMTALHQGKVLSEPMYHSLITPGKLNDGTPFSYAKGWVNFSNYGHKEISHGGIIEGFSAFVQYLPDEDLYIICLINTFGSKKNGQSFAYDLTWKLLDKKKPQNVALDIDPKLLEGLYTGPTRGNNKDSIQVKSIADGIIIQKLKTNKIDTLKTYMGNNTWAVGNDRITIKNNEYRDIQPYAYYILKKEK